MLSGCIPIIGVFLGGMAVSYVVSIHITPRRFEPPIDDVFSLIDGAYLEKVDPAWLRTAALSEMQRSPAASFLVTDDGGLPRVQCGDHRVLLGKSEPDFEEVAKQLRELETVVFPCLAPAFLARTTYERFVVKSVLAALPRPPVRVLSPPPVVKLATVGIDFTRSGRVTTVSRVRPSSDAERAGLLAGDEIREIDAVETRFLKPEEMAEALAGPARTKTRLGVVTHGSSIVRYLDVERELFDVAPLPIVEDGDVRLVGISGIGPETASALRAGLAAHSRDDSSVIVLDLRNAREGDIADAAEIAAVFLPQGVVVAGIEERMKRAPTEAVNRKVEATADGTVTRYLAAVHDPVVEPRLVALVDRRTGFAGQAVAAALRHYERARLVGVAPDPGDGRVTTDFLLSDGYPIRMETGVLLRPSGKPATSEPIVVDVDEAPCAAADTLDPCRAAVRSAAPQG